MGSGGQSKVEVKKGPWTRDEDQKLLSYIQQHGHGSWRTLPEKAGLERCGKSCRLRWTNYLRPDIKRGKFSSHEEKSIIRLHALLGNRWSAISAHLPNRTDNEIKNYWNTRLKKRLTRMGIDPTTHKPRNNQAGSKHSATVNHMAQWESARLEAEARLARAPNLSLLQRATAAPPPPPPCLDVLKVWEATALPVGFFGSAESPTSTLLHGYSSPAAAAVTAPTVLSCSVKESDVMSENNNVVLDWYSEMVNSLPLDESDGNMVYSVDYDFDAVGSMDRLASNYDDYSATVGPSEDGNNDNNHWNDLFHLVSSTM